MRIRPAHIEDLGEINDIYNEAVETLTASYAYAPDSLEDRKRWFEERQASGHPVFVAVDESGRVVGWSALGEFRSRYGYRFTAEDSIYVAADQRGNRIGSLLLAALIEAARKMNLHAIIAGIDSEGEASVRLHERFGFVKVGHLKEVGNKFDRWLDVIFMELLL